MNNIIEIRVLEPNEIVNCLEIDITHFWDKDKPVTEKAVHREKDVG